jgi:hypothetical protein
MLELVADVVENFGRMRRKQHGNAEYQAQPKHYANRLAQARIGENFHCSAPIAKHCAKARAGTARASG